MSLDALFSYANLAAMVGWLTLAVLPHRVALARPLVIALALLLAALYAALVGVHFADAEGGFDSLANVERLFESRGVLLAGWVHYLAFDLLIGLWEREEARRIGLARWLLVPCLFLTFMFGPLGWLLFMGLREVRLRMGVSAEETVS